MIFYQFTSVCVCDFSSFSDLRPRFLPFLDLRLFFLDLRLFLLELLLLLLLPPPDGALHTDAVPVTTSSSAASSVTSRYNLVEEEDYCYHPYLL